MGKCLLRINNNNNNNNGNNINKTENTKVEVSFSTKLHGHSVKRLRHKCFSVFTVAFEHAPAH